MAESDAWDRHVELEERLYQAMIQNKTCADCSKCMIPCDEFKNPDDIAWCKHFEDFVRSSSTPRIEDCESFI